MIPKNYDQSTGCNTSRFSSDSNIHHKQQQQLNRYASRWDDLPKKTNSRNRFSSSVRPNSFDTKSYDQSVPSVATTTGRMNHYNNHHRWNGAATHEKDDLLKQYRCLQVCCLNSPIAVSSVQNNKEIKALNDLLQFMTKYYKTLPAEETAIVVVHDILLPTLQSLLSQSSSLDEPLEQQHGRNSTSLVKAVFDVIQKLLLSNPHASAMLSPIDRKSVV